MSKLKNNKGITLVALIITIIILLILAMVSIRLVMNGGIIERAEKSTQKYSEEEIGEQLKLVYSEYQMSQYTGTPLDIQARLRENYGNDTIATLKNGKLTATIGGKVYQYNAGTGKSGKYVDPINYGEKTKATIEPGDDITLGTERFKVFSVANGEIKAMPYYNIELKLDNPKQSAEAGTIGFASQYYWGANVNEIDMDNPKNNVQKYINAYQKTLESFGAEFVEVRISRLDELLPVVAYRNPSETEGFWIGSSAPNNEEVRYVMSGNSQGIDYTTIWYQKGVRPIIIIQK